MEFRYSTNGKYYIGRLYDNDKEVCECKINIKNNDGQISSGYTNREYQNQGLGKFTMKNLIQIMHKDLGAPERIEYVWNGANEYVYDGISKNFGAISECPIFVQKTQSQEIGEDHMYYLNVNKFLNYFDIKREELEL